MGLNTRQWITLMTFYITYLFFGAFVFYQIEHGLEGEMRSNQLQSRIEINELLVVYAAPENQTIQNNIITKITDYCGKPVTNHTSDEFEKPYQWTFYHSIFFAFTVCSTLGYGNLAPTITLSRYFMIMYALIGMPINGILFAYLGEFFGSRFTAMYQRYKAYKRAHFENDDYAPQQLSMIAQITLTLLPASLVLIFLPSCLFTYFEGWPYSVSVYYSFVTLSTIGFGDFIPTFQPHQEREFGIYFQFYQIFVLIWFIFGLAYILMLIGFIAQGMRSKRIARLEQQLSQNIILTHNRIWSGVTKDVGYLRRILNEVYIMKAKERIYDVPECLEYIGPRRSISCPELTVYTVHSPVPHRKRAFSEQFCELSDADGGILGMRAISRQSEPNLLRGTQPIGSNLTDNTGDLLVNVVKALTTYEEEEQPDEGGIHLFSDSEIKLNESETESTSVIEPPKSLRERAASEYGRGNFFRNVVKQQEESRDWTWSGNNPQIQEFMKIRAKQKEREQNIKDLKTLNGGNLLIDMEKGQIAKERRPSIIQRINNLIKRRGTTSQLATISTPSSGDETRSKPMSPVQSPHPSVAKASNKSTPIDKRMSLARPHLMRQTSNFSVLSSGSDQDQEMLENTTIADLIRAMEMVHMKEMLGDHGYQTGETPPPAVKKAAAAFARGIKSRNTEPKTHLTSPTRLSPLPKLASSDEDFQASSVNWERLRQARLRQRSITDPQRFEPFSPFSKHKLIQDKASTSKRRYSAFPVAVNISDSSSNKWKQMMRKHASDLDRRFSVNQQPSVSPPSTEAPTPKDEFVRYSHILLNRARDDRMARLNRRSSSSQLPSNYTTPNRSVHITPISMRRTSMLPSSPLAGIPSTSSLASNMTSPLVTEPEVSENSSQNDEDVKSKSRWRPLLVRMLKDKPKKNSMDDKTEPKSK